MKYDPSQIQAVSFTMEEWNQIKANKNRKPTQYENGADEFLAELGYTSESQPSDTERVLDSIFDNIGEETKEEPKRPENVLTEDSLLALFEDPQPKKPKTIVECETDRRFMDIMEALDSFEPETTEPISNKGQSSQNTPSLNKGNLHDNVLSLNKGHLRLGRQWRVVLSNLLTLINHIDKTKNRTDGTFILSTHNKDLMRKFATKNSTTKHHRQVVNVISKAIEIGLLVVIDGTYAGGDGVSFEYRHARTFRYNGQVKREVLQMAEENSITAKMGSNKTKMSTTAKKPTAIDGLRVSSKHRIRGDWRKQTGVILSALYDTYPWFRDYQQLADTINQTHYLHKPERQVNLSFSIDFSQKGWLTGVGCRASSECCFYVSRKKEEANIKKYGVSSTAIDKTYREDYLNQVFDGQWYEYDVKSSIYRIMYYISHNEWLSNDVDLYEMMAGRKFTNDQDRADFKSYCMLLMFAGTPKQVLNAYNKQQQDTICNVLYKKYLQQTKDTATTLGQFAKKAKQTDLTKYYQTKTIEDVEADVKRMTDVLGTAKDIDGEVFLFESCIYLSLLNYLLDNGLDVVQVYDGFYSNDQRLITLADGKLKEIVEDFFTNVAPRDKNPTK